MDVRAFGSWTSAPTCSFFQYFKGLTELFARGFPPGYPRGRPPDIQPKNLLLGWDPAGLVWHGKRPKAGNGEKKMETEMENGPKLDRGKNGKKMARKWKILEGFFHYFSIFGSGHFFAIFLPLSSLGPFSIFFLHFRLLAVFHAIPARQENLLLGLL